MRIVVAPDSFKGSLTAAEAARAIADGVRRARPDAICDLVPLADGGEGTVDALVGARGGEERTAIVRGPWGEPVAARWGDLGDGLAVVEVASVVGLERMRASGRSASGRSVLTATSEGVGGLLLAAVAAGSTRLLVGLGGTGTNDAGAGLLAGLGALLVGADGARVRPEPRRLGSVVRVHLAAALDSLAGAEIELACDVRSPLLGPEGATAVFGEQKGVESSEIFRLDAALGGFAAAVETAIGRRVRDVPGAGAAGGLGFALLALGATRRDGIEIVMEATGLPERIAGADLVLTGEGAIDAQTSAGKALSGVAAVAARAGVPVIGFAGRVDRGLRRTGLPGFRALVPITPEGQPEEVAFTRAAENLTRAVREALAQRPGA